jgi:hypothetical protein
MAASTGVAKRTPARKTAPRKATPKVIEGVAVGRPQPVVDETDLPPELRDMYGPPKLSKARGAGTTGEPEADSFDFDTSTPVADIAMEKLFSIDGQQYFIPVVFPPSYSIVYLDAVQRGRDVAAGELLKLACGATGWNALVKLARDRPDLIKPWQLDGIISKILTKVMDTLEENGEGN